jgi:hypothetical protein
LNAFAERFVRSVRNECLSKVVPLGEPHLRELLHQYVAHHHAERNHQGLANALIENDNSATPVASRVASASAACSISTAGRRREHAGSSPGTVRDGGRARIAMSGVLSTPSVVER